MIHPDYSLKILDILLKTKPDDKYTTANDSDQQDVLSSPVLSKTENRTIKYSNYGYDNRAFVSIDNEIKKYNSSTDTELKVADEPIGKDAEDDAIFEATKLLNDKIAELKRDNIYNVGNFIEKEQSIVVPFSVIDPDGPVSNSKLFLPVGSRVSEFQFDEDAPTGKDGKYTYTLTLCVGKTTDRKEDLSIDIKTLITDKTDEMINTVKTFGSYKNATKTEYNTSKDENQAPTNPETLELKVRLGRIEKISADLYCKYSYKTSSSSNPISNSKKQTIEYYSIVYDEDITITIPSWYLSQTFGANDEGGIYPKKAFIGLFTKKPDNYGKGFVEPTWKTSDNTHTYQRMSLHEDLLYGDMSLNLVRQIEDTDEDKAKHDEKYLGHAFVDNKEIVLFPEILDDAGWGTIEGFGIFENEEPTADETPYFWGDVTNEKGEPTKVETFKNRVPLFRKGEFKVYLG